MRKVYLLLKDMKQKRMINEEQYKHIYIYTDSSTNPLFCAIIKIHMERYPIKLIVALNDSCTFHLSHYSSKILSPITDNAPQKLQNSSGLM